VLWAICSAAVLSSFFNDFCRTDYLKIHQTDLLHIFRVGRTVDGQSVISFSIPQRTLPRQSVFVGFIHGNKGNGNPYSITERRVPELIPVLGSQPAGDVSHKTGGRLPLLSARPAVTPATLKKAATNFAAW